jgi:hypothetical protein
MHHCPCCDQILSPKNGQAGIGARASKNALRPTSPSLCRFDHKPRADATGTNTNPPYRSVLVHMSHRLKIGLPDPLGLVVGMAHVVSNLRSLSTKFTFSAHAVIFLRFIPHRPVTPCLYRRCRLRTSVTITFRPTSNANRAPRRNHVGGCNPQSGPPESERNVFLAHQHKRGKRFSQDSSRQTERRVTLKPLCGSRSFRCL